MSRHYKIELCPCCGAEIQVGKNRNWHQRFCSVAHRVKFNRHLKSKTTCDDAGCSGMKNCFSCVRINRT